MLRAVVRGPLGAADKHEYVHGTALSAADSPELRALMHACKNALQAVEREYGAQLSVQQCPRSTTREHLICGKTARMLLRRGRDNRLPPAFPVYPVDCVPMVRELRRLLMHCV